MKRIICRTYIRLIRCFFSLWYNPKYLSGKIFDSEHLTKGWRQIWRIWFSQKILGWNRKIPWPCYPNILIANSSNIEFDVNDIDNFFSTGNYYQGIGAKIKIGAGTAIAPGVGIITANHNLTDITRSDQGKDVVIGKNCWIGMNAIILPGVTLGDGTVVGAGAIVTHSFPEGHCVIVGNPATVKKYIGI